MPRNTLPDWERMLAAAAHLQRILPRCNSLTRYPSNLKQPTWWNTSSWGRSSMTAAARKDQELINHRGHREHRGTATTKGGEEQEHRIADSRFIETSGLMDSNRRNPIIAAHSLFFVSIVAFAVTAFFAVDCHHPRLLLVVPPPIESLSFCLLFLRALCGLCVMRS